MWRKKGRKRGEKGRGGVNRDKRGRGGKRTNHIAKIT